MEIIHYFLVGKKGLTKECVREDSVKTEVRNMDLSNMSNKLYPLSELQVCDTELEEQRLDAKNCSSMESFLRN
jgi:hypothetical protein